MATAKAILQVVYSEDNDKKYTTQRNLHDNNNTPLIRNISQTGMQLDFEGFPLNLMSL